MKAPNWFACPSSLRVRKVRTPCRTETHVPRNSAIEGHRIAGSCRSGCRDKHCRKAGEEQRDENPCCWFSLNVLIFHMIFFSCFGFRGLVPGEPGDADRFPFLPASWPESCIESLELILHFAPAAAFFLLIFFFFFFFFFWVLF